jgi:hypothetical protein
MFDYVDALQKEGLAALVIAIWLEHFKTNLN